MVPSHKHLVQDKRSKVTLACTVCRKKKVKCNGIQPICDRCYATGAVCHYTTEIKKRGPVKRHVEIISNRTRRIESLLLLNENPTHHSVPSSKRNNPNTMSFSNQDEFNPVFKILAKWNHGPTNIVSLSDPKQQQQLAWAKAVLCYFNVLFPILSRHHFLYHFTEYRHTATMDPALRYAVYALGACYEQHPARKLLFDKATRLLSIAAPLHVCLSTVQALVIMCWCAFLLGEMDSCRLIRHRLALLKFDRATSLTEEELYNRAAWVIYVMDQWLFIATDERSPMTGPPMSHRPPRLEDDQLLAIDSQRQKKRAKNTAVESMKRTSSSNSDEHHYADAAALLQITVFAETTRLADIVYRNPADRNSLTTWLAALPSYLEIGSSNVFSMTRLLHIFYHAVVLVHHKDPMAMRAMLAIAEQTEVPLLYNVFGVALTHAVHYCLCTTSQIYLDKSLKILTTANPTLLSQNELEVAIKTNLVLPANLVFNNSNAQLQVLAMMMEEQQHHDHHHNDNTTKQNGTAEDEGALAIVPNRSVSLPPSPPELDLARLLQSPAVSSDMFTPWNMSSLALSPDGSPAIPTHQEHIASPALTMAPTPAESFDASPTSYYLTSPCQVPISKRKSHVASETSGYLAFPLLQ